MSTLQQQADTIDQTHWHKSNVKQLFWVSKDSNPDHFVSVVVKRLSTLTTRPWKYTLILLETICVWLQLSTIDY